MRRREFIVLLGGTVAARPLAARAQQPALPVIGFISSASLTGQVPTAFKKGLNEGGYFDDQNVKPNVKIEFYRADGHYDRLPALARDMVDRQVNLIVAAGGLPSALAAKAATTTIPILFVAGFDPIKVGLVASLNRPGGNATGVSVYTTELIAKRLQLLRELMPSADSVALLVNPDSPVADIETKDVEAAARAAGLQLLILEARVENDFEDVFASAIRQRAGGLLVSADPFFTTRRSLLIALAERHALPAAYPWREYAEIGGLMSYGPYIFEQYRQLGLYASRILKGAAPRDLPVQLPKEFELIINYRTVKALGLSVSKVLRAAATKIIE